MREIDIAFGVSRDVMPRSQNAGRLDRAHDIERLAINDGNAFVGTHIQELLSSVGGQRQIACKRRVGALANVLTPRKGRATSTFPTGLYRLIDKLYQGFTLERFAQEAQGSGLYCPRPRPLLGESGHEDDGGPPTLRQ